MYSHTPRLSERKTKPCFSASLTAKLQNSDLVSANKVPQVPEFYPKVNYRRKQVEFKPTWEAAEQVLFWVGSKESTACPSYKVVPERSVLSLFPHPSQYEPLISLNNVFVLNLDKPGCCASAFVIKFKPKKKKTRGNQVDHLSSSYTYLAFPPLWNSIPNIFWLLEPISSAKIVIFLFTCCSLTQGAQSTQAEAIVYNSMGLMSYDPLGCHYF